MKKYILTLCTIVSAGQCYSMASSSKTHTALMKLYAPIHNLPIEQITYPWLKSLSNVVADITTQAIHKSKDALGRQDTDLTAAATEVSDITNEIVGLYLKIKTTIEQLKKDGSARSFLATRADILTRRLTNINQKISRSYITISKQQAQKSLQETITFLKNPVLSGIEQELSLLDPNYFA